MLNGSFLSGNKVRRRYPLVKTQQSEGKHSYASR